MNRRAWTTLVFVKQLMAVSGLFFVLFVLMHSYGNLKILAGPDAYNEYAHHLRTFLTPILPYEGLLWILRVGMVALIFIHILCAMYLWHRAGAARGSSYDTKKYVANNYATRTVRVGSILLLFFIVFHILHFTTKTIQIGDGIAYKHAMYMPKGGHEMVDAAPWNMMITTFSMNNWWSLIIYLVAVGILGLHVGHGIWSALQSLGWIRRNLQIVIVAVSGLVGFAVFAMFAIPPLYLTFAHHPGFVGM